MDAADDVEDGANPQAGAQAQAQPPQAVALVALEQSIARAVEASFTAREARNAGTAPPAPPNIAPPMPVVPPALIGQGLPPPPPDGPAPNSAHFRGILILLRSKPPMSTANWWPAVVRAPAAKRCDPPPRAEPLSFFLVGSIRCSTARSSDCWLSNCPQCTRSGCRCNGTSPFLSRRRVYHPSPPCGPHLRLRNC